MMSSTRSRESALRSSTNEASGFTSASSTPSCSTTIFLRRSYVFWSAPNRLPPCQLPAAGFAPGNPAKCRGRRTRPSIGASTASPDGRGEHAVHELRRDLRPEQLGQLARFVDDGRRRCVPRVPELVQGDTQDVLVDL